MKALFQIKVLVAYFILIEVHNSQYTLTACVALWGLYKLASFDYYLYSLRLKLSMSSVDLYTF